MSITETTFACGFNASQNFATVFQSRWNCWLSDFGNQRADGLLPG